ncbi:hypothetical protein [Streptomyces sp. NPDC056194]|uniref:LppU/SCO3897 family protein n=1 Tax=unclassified Streptomyces TaxID=2593676 RepID=UPI0035E2B526
MPALTPPALLAGAIPTLLLVGLLAGPGDGHAGLSVGDCVADTAEWPEQALLKVDCGSPQAGYRVADEASCGPEDHLLRAEYSIDSPGKPSYRVRPL